MKLSVVQFCPEFREKKKNLSKIIDYVRQIESDIIVLPELCTTGYFFQSKEEVSEFAEPKTGETITTMQDIATKMNKILVIGYAELDGDNIYNSAVIVMPDKSLTKIYRKTHLFYKERFCFAEGDSGYFIVEDKRRDIKIGVMICYDWRFPEAARSLALLGADLIVCPSNLVTKVWPKVMPARAIENKVYIAIANRYGTETSGNEEVQFNGRSGIWKYNGDVMAQAAVEEETVLTVEIDPQKTRKKSFNEFNDIFGDRRP
jgi:predicted amidohydrolase